MKFAVRQESWPLTNPFTISRGTKTTADVLVVTAHHEGQSGSGECVPYPRYDETTETVRAQIERFIDKDAASFDHALDLCSAMPPGAARNAVNCALWDWQNAATGTPLNTLAAVPALTQTLPITTAFTISLGTPEQMAIDARSAVHMPLLKLKLGHDDALSDIACMKAVRNAVPNARLIIDANEAWHPGALPNLFAAAASASIELIEQPLPTGEDASLANVQHTVPICADESCHTAADIKRLTDRYDVINIKLDKSGGLTEALRMVTAAQAHDMKIMIGCMVATSRAMTPALYLCHAADWIDLDGPLLLAKDHDDAIQYRDGQIIAQPASLWGSSGA